nr:hypothetical protein [Tanacetum cinerariifolium]
MLLERITPDAIIKCIKNIQVRLNATVCNVIKDNKTEFVDPTLRDFNENTGFSHQTSIARTPQQNDVVERQNRTLVVAACTIEDLGKLNAKADIEILSGEIKVHIEVLSVLWGNRLPIWMEAAAWLAANDLYPRYCAGGGWTNGRMTRHHGTVAAAEGSVRGFNTRFRWFRKKVSTRFRKKSILEAEVEQCDWWIKNITAANDEI